MPLMTIFRFWSGDLLAAVRLGMFFFPGHLARGVLMEIRSGLP